MRQRQIVLLSVIFFLFILAVYGQSNAKPFISALSPVSAAPGGGDFTLTLFGTGFTNGQSAIYWDGSPLPDLTSFIPASPPNLASCKATVRASMSATAGTA